MNAAPHHVEFAVHAHPQNVSGVRARVGELARAAGLLPSEVDAVRLCVTEALANAIVHAYGGRGGTVELSVEDGDRELVVMVRDFGVGMFTRRAPRADGGYGLRIIERLAHHCSITSTPGQATEVRMTFSCEREGEL